MRGSVLTTALIILAAITLLLPVTEGLSPQVAPAQLLEFARTIRPSLAGVDDLELVELEAGNTNYCFKVISKTTNENVMFLKHAKAVTRRGGGHLSIDRLGYEQVGLEGYRKVIPGVVPKVLGYCTTNKILALECISAEYVPMQSLLEKGSGGSDGDVSRVVGTIMGRSHARSHELLVTVEQAERYKATFANADAFELWKNALFEPTIQGLANTPPHGLEQSEAAEVREAVSLLLEIYLSRKECLIHNDLHCNNILVAPDEGQPLDQRCKVVDFERCALGPAGLDLGMYLAGELYYYVGHSDPGVRRGLKAGMIAAIDAYNAAFRVQAQSLIAQRLVAMNVDRSLARVLRDAMGFMALYNLFLVYTKPEINFMSLERTPGYSWGDAEGRKAFVHARLNKALLGLFRLFLRGEDLREQELLAGLVDVLGEDEGLLLSGHQTEFWF